MKSFKIARPYTPKITISKADKTKNIRISKKKMNAFTAMEAALDKIQSK